MPKHVETSLMDVWKTTLPLCYSEFPTKNPWKLFCFGRSGIDLRSSEHLYSPYHIAGAKWHDLQKVLCLGSWWADPCLEIGGPSIRQDKDNWLFWTVRSQVLNKTSALRYPIRTHTILLYSRYSILWVNSSLNLNWFLGFQRHVEWEAVYEGLHWKMTPRKGVIFFDARRILLEHKLSENHANRPALGTISSSLPADCFSLWSKFSSFLERRIEKVFQTTQRL